MALKLKRKLIMFLRSLQKRKNYQSIYLKLNTVDIIWIRKAHKKYVDNCQPFHHYSLAKLLISILKLLIQNEFTVKDLLEFSNNISSQDSILFMARLDIDTSFTIIPSENRVNVCVDSLSRRSEIVNNQFIRHEFK